MLEAFHQHALAVAMLHTGCPRMLHSILHVAGPRSSDHQVSGHSLHAGVQGCHGTWLGPVSCVRGQLRAVLAGLQHRHQ